MNASYPALNATGRVDSVNINNINTGSPDMATGAIPPTPSSISASPTTTTAPAPERERVTRVRVLRSCISCRNRKIKCDRQVPCGACQKSNFQCVFPAQKRKPPRPKQPDAVLVDRLARLENVIEELSKGGANGSTQQNGMGGGESSPTESAGANNDGMNSRPVGRLLMSDKKSRYLGPSFWGSVSDEVENLRELLLEDEEQDSGHEDQGQHSPSPQQSSFFFRTTTEDLSWFHPPFEDVQFLYQQFVSAVDPFVRIIHKPTFEAQLAIFVRDRHNPTLSKGFEALVFSVYHAAVVSMHSDDVLARYRMQKKELLAHYRIALENALSNARFLQSEELTTLQALVLMVSVLREPDELRTMWTMIGLAIRIAQSLGLHRDPSLFGMSLIDSECRRRVWYEICHLDVRAAEEHGMEPTLNESSYDTRIPLNINDRDLTNDMNPNPPHNPNFTEMTFNMMRYEAMPCFRQLTAVSPISAKQKKPADDKDAMIDRTFAQIQNRYLQHLDIRQPMQHTCLLVSRMMLARAKQILFHPYRHFLNGELLSTAQKDSLFQSSVESLENSIEVAHHSAPHCWTWFFQSFHQPHATALILLELSVREPSELVERAWRAIETFMGTNDLFRTGSPEQSARYWRPLAKLKERALRNRQSSKSPGISSASPTSSNDGELVQTPMDSSGLSGDSPIDWVSGTTTVAGLNLPPAGGFFKDEWNMANTACGIGELVGGMGRYVSVCEDGIDDGADSVLGPVW